MMKPPSVAAEMPTTPPNIEGEDRVDAINHDVKIYTTKTIKQIVEENPELQPELDTIEREARSKVFRKLHDSRMFHKGIHVVAVSRIEELEAQLNQPKEGENK